MMGIVREQEKEQAPAAELIAVRHSIGQYFQVTSMSLIHERVKNARAGSNPTVIARMRSGWLVMADRQIVLGYCLLLPDPVVVSINDLNDIAREEFLMDMVLAGDALLRATDATRINYEILGDSDPFLHAHIFPR
jgi:diadenosine tetraphosphate (Ap4A) HIT family hydrolase